MNCSHVYEVRPGRSGHYEYCDEPVPMVNDEPLTVNGNAFCLTHYVNDLHVDDME